MNIITVPSIDSVAFSAKSNSNNDKQNGKPIPICEYYKKLWHTKENCWKLHGWPSNSNHSVLGMSSLGAIAQLGLELEKMIGTTQHSRGLYLLDDDAFSRDCSRTRIVHQSSCAYTRQQNGVVEQKNRHLLEDNIVDVVEEDKDNVKVLEEGKAAKCDENRADIQLGETSSNDSDKPRSYDPCLDMPIALRKGTRISLQVLSPKWKAIVMEEMGALEKNKTWDLFAKGFTQTYGTDYSATFSHVAKLNTVKVLLSVAVNKKWPLHQLDVKTVFLNGNLEEEVYKSSPPRSDVQFNHQVWDDIAEIIRLKRKIGDNFENKDLESKVLPWDRGCMTKGRNFGFTKEYTLDLLKEIGTIGCRPADTPMEFNIKLGYMFKRFDVNNDVYERRGVTWEVLLTKFLLIKKYQQFVGKLIDLRQARPNISCAVSIVSQFTQASYEEHIEAVNHILRYLKTTPRKGLMFRKTGKRCIEACTDSDWEESVTYKKSTLGYYIFVWGNLVNWRSKKQGVVARSSVEAKYRAMSLGIYEEIWLQKVLFDLHQGINLPMKVFCDNKAAISIANGVQHDRTKHVEIDKHFIKEKPDNFQYLYSIHSIKSRNC
ncbi:Cysteine-rich RLK (receptor-like protein kinase) 8 [Cucumis melo var. makuwa]|uniref:Cysteine-rich RLK (Receptor-like protein kinase) 8 n=1 Tax=Cucumis melo var. makuwa TaxID=1194695 RepID=A0A5D3BFQ3_CUCMM|nr:Cysteine-rich RLK (receptor-like protein kinase) 8 [Cucumis melo var. makuwa]